MEPASPSPENVTQKTAVRAALRREKLAARAALPAAVRLACEARIAAHVEAALSDSAVSPAPTFCCCWPHQGEVDVLPLAQRLRARGWTVGLPVVVAESAALAFRAWTPTTPLEPDRYGIPTPVAGPFIRPDILLIPLVAFDAANYRIGYGGGFFDRTLADLAARGARPLTIGVGFELARVPDTLPGLHDIPLDIVVTETGLWRRPG